VSARTEPGLRLAILYALPALALAVPTIPVAVYLPSFYADTVGLGLQATGLALLLSRGLDVVTDPVAGVLSDRTRSRFGRRKPWTVAGACVAAPALVALFNPPESASVVYLLGVSAVLYVGWTMVAVPYFAWAAELATDYGGRARLTAWREGFTLVGIVLAGAVPAVVTRTGGTEADGLLAVSLVAVAVGVPAFFALALWVPDQRPAADARTHRFSMRGTVRALSANGPFRRLLGAWFVNGMANGLPAALFPLYLAHGVGANETEKATLIFLYFAAGIAALPLWLRLSRHIGKHRAWCVAMAVAIAAFVWVPFLGPGDVMPFAVICVVSGSALGADLALPPAIQADVIDYDRWRTHHDRAATFFAVWGMATKLALALGVGIAFPTLDAFGFDLGGENDALALTALAVIYAGLPCVLKAVSIAMVWNHPITPRRLAAIQARLARRQG
jgi:GPH family glycoside/pentoside/hexuronide:cation symporter